MHLIQASFLSKQWGDPQFIKLKGGKEPPLIIVFHKDTYEEKEAYLIRRLISNEWNQLKVLDIAFIETMISYFAYKYADGNIKLGDQVKSILRKEYEECSYRNCIVKLDDPEYEHEVVINLPPQIKPILHDIILPLAIDQNKRTSGKSFYEKETLKVELMEMISSICNRNCGILFIGDLPVDDYCRMLRSKINKFDYFSLAARGVQTFVLINVNETFFSTLPRSVRYKRTTYEGSYYFRNQRRGSSNYNYTLLRKTSSSLMSRR